MSSSHNNLKLPIYMDYQATTPVQDEVLKIMLPYFSDKFGNPHSRTHSFGWESEEAVEIARKQIAEIINADTKEIIFTSGATESNNLAIKGVANFYNKQMNKNHIITVITEHKCILDTCRVLEASGFKITYLNVDKEGLINLDDLRKAITKDTAIVSIMSINNEIGVIQPLAEIGQICRENSVFFHTDAAQAFGKIPLDVKAMKIDLMSISGHKIYGPKGVGALYVGKKPRVRLEAMIDGGKQERGMRSGTLPTPLIVGLGAAAEYAKHNMQKDYDHIKKLSDIMIEGFLSMDSVYLNGSKTQRFPGCLNFSFACVEGESLIGIIKDIAVSSGSACTSSSLEPSYVIKGLGIDSELSHTSIRFGIGRSTTEAEINYVVKSVKNAVLKLRELSPLWDMRLNGIDIKSIKWSTH